MQSNLVRKIAEFTGHRDLGMLEECLLRTLDEMLAPEWSAIYRVEMTGEASAPPDFSIALRDGKICDAPIISMFWELLDFPDIVVIPILSRKRLVLGYVAIKRAAYLTEQEQELATAIFRIYDNYLDVLRDAQLDKLTGLLNRHTFDTQLERTIDLAKRSGRPRTEIDGGVQEKPQRAFLGVIDIDHFKRVNDTFGHLYGDEVLLIVARLLQENFRKGDLVYRFGGEEFVVIVIAPEYDGAIDSFERLRAKIENYPFPQVGKVTISVGVTEIRDMAMPVQILGHADQALYYAKNNGRNQVCSYEFLVSSDAIQLQEKSGELTLF